MSKINILVAIYMFMFIVTFGHSYNHQSEIVYVDGRGEVRLDDTMKGAGAIISGIFWPLYWSADFFKVKS